MREVIEYRIVSEHAYNGVDVLARKVREHIAMGWQPIGGVSATKSDSDGRFQEIAQAMVLYGKAKKQPGEMM